MKTLHFSTPVKASSWATHAFSLLSRKENEVTPLLPFMSCRSYMCDTLFKLKLPVYKGKPTYPFNFNYKSGDIYVGIEFPGEEHKQIFIKNIVKLHQIEAKAKVKKSVVYKTNNNLFLVVRGSKFWKDSCWKMMLYTFYLKTFGYTFPKITDKPYWDKLNIVNPNTGETNEEVLLSKIKCTKEIFHKSVYGEGFTTGMHSREGFVSICSGSNKPMAEFLGVWINEKN